MGETKIEDVSFYTGMTGYPEDDHIFCVVDIGEASRVRNKGGRLMIRGRIASRWKTRELAQLRCPPDEHYVVRRIAVKEPA